MNIILFDIDGTLVTSGNKLDNIMIDAIIKLSQLPNTVLGLVGAALMLR